MVVVVRGMGWVSGFMEWVERHGNGEGRELRSCGGGGGQGHSTAGVGRTPDGGRHRSRAGAFWETPGRQERSAILPRIHRLSRCRTRTPNPRQNAIVNCQ